VNVPRISDLLENNRRWAARMVEDDPSFFKHLVLQQAPRYLWIGCSDSRVPANQIVDLRPGELFVHRNVANLVSQSDMNCLSVLQYAIETLQVEHVIVCGHYGCGGVRSVIEGNAGGLVEQWLRPIRELHDTHKGALAALPDESARADRLCELNVLEQVRQVGLTAAVQHAWRREQRVAVHGWIYGLHDGRLRDLQCSIDAPGALDSACAIALDGIV
jgi:carbonic anhydrase